MLLEFQFNPSHYTEYKFPMIFNLISRRNQSILSSIINIDNLSLWLPIYFFFLLQKLANDDKLNRMKLIRTNRTELGKNEWIATEDGQNYGNDITVVARKRPGNLPVGPSACTLHLLRRRRGTLPPLWFGFNFSPKIKILCHRTRVAFNPFVSYLIEKKFSILLSYLSFDELTSLPRKPKVQFSISLNFSSIN